MNTSRKRRLKINIAAFLTDLFFQRGPSDLYKQDKDEKKIPMNFPNNNDTTLRHAFGVEY